MKNEKPIKAAQEHDEIDHCSVNDKTIEANFDMPCEAGGIGTIVPGLF